MAKKKQATGSNGGVTKTRKKSSAAVASHSPSSNDRHKTSGASFRGRDELSNQMIGETAGQLWQQLSENGPQSVTSLKKSLGAPDELVLLALGWLAREDKLEFESSARSTTVSLRS